MQEVIEDYAREFDRCAQWIEAALPYANGCYDLQSVRDACLSGKMQLWPGARSALVTEIIHYPLRTGCIVAFAGGDLDELRAMSVQVRAWAKAKGCDFRAVNGPKEWVKALGFGRVVSTISVEDL